MSRKNNKKSENANMDCSAGKNSLSTNPVKNCIIYDEKVYYVHPIYTNYAASKYGKVINCKTLRTLVCRQNHTGYLSVGVRSDDKKTKDLHSS